MNLVRRRHPEIRLSLQSGFSQELEEWLLDGRIDLAVDPLENRPARLHSLRLMRLPVVLLVPRKSRIKASAELRARGRVKEPLISLPATEIISRLFQKGLKRLGVEWPPAIEASSLEVITRYVANGDGIGVTVNLPGAVKHPDVRMLPLEGFEPLDVRAHWHGQLTPVIRAVLEEGQRYVRQSWPEWQVEDTLPEPADSRTGG